MNNHEQYYSYTFTVPLHDIDAAGILFFAHLYRHAHDAYEAFMNDIGFSLQTIIAQQQKLPIVHSEADFQQAIRHGETITIILQLAMIANSSFSIQYQFLDVNKQQRASVLTTHVNLNTDSQKSQALPSDLKLALSRYLSQS